MSRVISVFNQKGGVGKSTTVSCLGAGLTQKNKKVLLCDIDPQSNCTNAVGINDEDLDISIYNLLSSKTPNKDKIEQAIQKTQYKNLDILPSDISLSNAEITLSGMMSRENILDKVISQVKDDYDYTIIDCPPSLGLLSINSLVASDFLIIPVSPSYFSIKGIKNLLDTINIVKDNLKPSLEIMGVLITMFDIRKNLSKDIKNTLVEVFGDKVFDTVIRINAQIEYSQESRTPVIFYNKDSNGYIDYMNLVKEVLKYEKR